MLASTCVPRSAAFNCVVVALESRFKHEKSGNDQRNEASTYGDHCVCEAVMSPETRRRNCRVASPWRLDVFLTAWHDAAACLRIGHGERVYAVQSPSVHVKLRL